MYIWYNLSMLSKIVLMGHEMWLHKDDEWRRCPDLFDGADETRVQPCPSREHEIYKLLKDWKEFPKPRKKRNTLEQLFKVRKRKSIFFVFSVLASP